MKNGSRVSVPIGERFRDFRYRILPPLTFVAVVALVALLWAGYIEPEPVSPVTITAEEDCPSKTPVLTSVTHVGAHDVGISNLLPEIDAPIPYLSN